MKVFNVGSLFAGIGGIDLGFQNSIIDDNGKYNIVWANEIDEYAATTYRQNFSHPLIEGDINLVLNPDLLEDKDSLKYKYYVEKNKVLTSQRIDVLVGGFPCQAFSIAGEMRGFEDERGNLFWAIIHTVKQLEANFGKPRVLFLENVKNLKSHDNGNTYKVIKSEIEKLGYFVKEHILNTAEYSNLPQNRERIYIVCFLNKEDADRFTMFDNLENYKIRKTKEEKLEQVKKIIDYSNQIPEKYYYNHHKYPNYFQDTSINEGINLNHQITEMYQFYQLRRGMYVRQNKNNVCPTLTANMGTGGHNVPLILTENGVRKITPVEALKLQGFPIDEGYKLPKHYKGRVYADANLYKQAGNAVSVPVIELIATEILKVLIHE